MSKAWRLSLCSLASRRCSPSKTGRSDPILSGPVHTAAPTGTIHDSPSPLAAHLLLCQMHEHKFTPFRTLTHAKLVPFWVLMQQLSTPCSFECMANSQVHCS
mmetsp:Transcript_19141/g.53604  ORF Transcript_19141/g.53604 Transcript_19141/m.53604 type:complete len:102 (+) Transcript_19141:1061-1366(+)